MNTQQLEKLEKAQNYAISRGGVCLSHEYKNNKEKLLWKCSNREHPEWESSYDNAMNKNAWCMHCSGKIKKESSVGLKEAQDYAHSKGGQCLSTEYVSRQKKLEWKCSNSEHISWMAPTDLVIYKKTWCPQCGIEKQKEIRKDPLGLKKAQEYAISRGGKCLSQEYRNQNTNLEWKCSNQEHASWFALPKIMNRETWCSKCSRKAKRC